MNKRLKMLLDHLKREEKLKINAELEARLAQINPHFLYNTLDMINWMVMKKADLEASDMIGNLARLYRISLSKGGLFILLGEELEHGYLYYELQRARYKNNIKYIQSISTNHKTLYVPKLILQPFIENAIIHGFNSMIHNAENPMEIRVESLLENGVLFISIVNTGNSLSQSGAIKKEFRTHSGYGFKNVKERIELYFGAGFGVDIQDLHPSGVKVTITLPETRSLDDLDPYSQKEDIMYLRDGSSQ